MDVAILVGLQGSGKTTFAQTFFPPTHVQVSKDRLRNNRRPQRRQMQLIEEALIAGHSVVVDNTNPTPEDRAPIIALARSYNATVLGFIFPPDLDACLERNRQRQGRQRVPDRALYITSRKLSLPSQGEGFDRLYRVAINPEGGFTVDPIDDGLS